MEINSIKKEKERKGMNLTMNIKLTTILSPIECRQYRYALGMTCEDVASIMNLTRQELSSIETCRNTKLSTIKYLSIVLLILWDDIPDSEKQVRMECAKLGIRYGTPVANRLSSNIQYKSN